jgi:hypothetical protein
MEFFAGWRVEFAQAVKIGRRKVESVIMKEI